MLQNSVKISDTEVGKSRAAVSFKRTISNLSTNTAMTRLSTATHEDARRYNQPVQTLSCGWEGWSLLFSYIFLFCLFHRSNKSTSKTCSQFSDSSDDEAAPEYSKKPAPLPKWKIPKFYVRPQDRHKTEDMFLMRRYTLLQRQVAMEIPEEVVKANDKLNINITFSRLARQKQLKVLVDENSLKLNNEKKTYRDTGLNNRIERFLSNIDNFKEQQHEQDS